MDKIITLPKSKAQVTLRDPEEIRQKDRRKVLESINEHSNGIIRGLDATEGLIAILVKSWTLDLMLPSIRIDILGELEIADYDFLANECKQAESALFPDFTNDSNPDSPLDKSNA